MLKKLLIVFLVIICVVAISYSIWKNNVNFPSEKYDHASILYLDRSVLDTASDEFIEKLLPINERSDGMDFLNEKGIPVHEFYKEYLLTNAEIQNLQNCFQKQGFDLFVTTKCYPTYRDAIVYYDKNNTPLAWASICFECDKIYVSAEDLYVSPKSIDGLEKVFTLMLNGWTKI